MDNLQQLFLQFFVGIASRCKQKGIFIIKRQKSAGILSGKIFPDGVRGGTQDTVAGQMTGIFAYFLQAVNTDESQVKGIGIISRVHGRVEQMFFDIMRPVGLCNRIRHHFMVQITDSFLYFFLCLSAVKDKGCNVSPHLQNKLCIFQQNISAYNLKYLIFYTFEFGAGLSGPESACGNTVCALL